MHRLRCCEIQVRYAEPRKQPVEEMILYLILLAVVLILIFAPIVLSLVAFVRSRRVNELTWRVQQLEAVVRELRSGGAEARPAPAPAPASAPAPIRPEPAPQPRRKLSAAAASRVDLVPL